MYPVEEIKVNIDGEEETYIRSSFSHTCSKCGKSHHKFASVAMFHEDSTPHVKIICGSCASSLYRNWFNGQNWI